MLYCFVLFVLFDNKLNVLHTIVCLLGLGCIPILYLYPTPKVSTTDIRVVRNFRDSANHPTALVKNTPLQGKFLELHAHVDVHMAYGS